MGSRWPERPPVGDPNDPRGFEVLLARYVDWLAVHHYSDAMQVAARPFGADVCRVVRGARRGAPGRGNALDGRALPALRLSLPARDGETSGLQDAAGSADARARIF